MNLCFFSGKITGDELRRILTQLGRMRLSLDEADQLIGQFLVAFLSLECVRSVFGGVSFLIVGRSVWWRFFL